MKLVRRHGSRTQGATSIDLLPAFREEMPFRIKIAPQTISAVAKNARKQSRSSIFVR